MSLLNNNNNNNNKDTLRVAKIVIQRIMSRCSEPNKMMKRACDLIGSNEIATTIIGSAPRKVKIEYEVYERLIEDKDTDIALAARLNKEKDEAILSKVRGVRSLKHVTQISLYHSRVREYFFSLLSQILRVSLTVIIECYCYHRMSLLSSNVTVIID